MIDVKHPALDRKGPSDVAAADLLRGIFAALNASNIEYCVLHGYEKLPNIIVSDVDMVVERSSFADALTIFEQCADDAGWMIVNYLQHEHTMLTTVLASQDHAGQIHILALDMCTDFCRSGVVYLSNALLLKHRQAYDGFYVPAPAVELIFLLVKRTLKRRLEPNQAIYLAQLYAQEPDAAAELLHDLWGPEYAALLNDLLSTDPYLLTSKLQDAHRRLLSRQRERTTRRRPVAFVYELQRLWQRMLFPIGFVVAFLGPDGAGKSTVVSRVIQQLRPIFFGGSNTFHFSIRLVQRNSSNILVTNPHAMPNRTAILSLMKLLYYVLEFIVGYFAHIRMMTVRDQLIVFDRCFHDMIADPRRYRFGAPLWTIRLLGVLVPRADYTFILDAPAEVLLERKSEVPLADVVQQRIAYHRLAATLSRTAVIDASLPLEQVVTCVNAVLLDQLSRRAVGQRRRLKVH